MDLVEYLRCSTKFQRIKHLSLALIRLTSWTAIKRNWIFFWSIAQIASSMKFIDETAPKWTVACGRFTLLQRSTGDENTWLTRDNNRKIDSREKGMTNRMTKMCGGVVFFSPLCSISIKEINENQSKSIRS